MNTSFTAWIVDYEVCCRGSVSSENTASFILCGWCYVSDSRMLTNFLSVYAVQERQKAQKASYAADNPLAAIGGGTVGGPRGGGLRGLQTPLGWLANRAFPTVGTR